MTANRLNYSSIGFLAMLKLKNLRILNFLILMGIIVVFLLFLLAKETVMAEDFLNEEEMNFDLALLQENSLIGQESTFVENDPEIIRRIRVIVTGYSSSIQETQGDPFITASGERVREGIIANNLLRFDSKIRLPELFGNSEFIVKDRMNSKKGYYHVDIWFPSRQEALEFGSKLAVMEVLR